MTEDFIKVTPRMQRSVSLQRLIVAKRREELDKVIALLLEGENSGKIDWYGPDKENNHYLQFEPRTGFRLKVESTINCLEFWEAPEIIQALKEAFPLKWENLLMELEDEMTSGLALWNGPLDLPCEAEPVAAKSEGSA